MNSYVSAYHRKCEGLIFLDEVFRCVVVVVVALCVCGMAMGIILLFGADEMR